MIVFGLQVTTFFHITGFKFNVTLETILGSCSVMSKLFVPFMTVMLLIEGIKINFCVEYLLICRFSLKLLFLNEI